MKEMVGILDSSLVADSETGKLEEEKEEYYIVLWLFDLRVSWKRRLI
jgi:hypothetical protein